MKRLLAALSLLVTVAVAGAALEVRADDDHERARRALEAGEIVPLADILAGVQRDFMGDVLEVELEDEHGRWLYEIKLLAPDGGLIKLQYDARTKELLGGRGRSLDKARRTR
jgi:uncharacterized membrane protein YkoI